MDKIKKDKKAQELFGLNYDRLCNPDRKAVREALKTKGGLGRYDKSNNKWKI